MVPRVSLNFVLQCIPLCNAFSLVTASSILFIQCCAFCLMQCGLRACRLLLLCDFIVFNGSVQSALPVLHMALIFLIIISIVFFERGESRFSFAPFFMPSSFLLCMLISPSISQSCNTVFFLRCLPWVVKGCSDGDYALLCPMGSIHLACKGLFGSLCRVCFSGMAAIS